MNNQPISRKQFLSAQYNVQRINPVISAMEQLDKQVVGSEEQFLEILDFDRFLKKIRDSNLAILGRTEIQYKERDADLINAAAARLNQIPRDIEREEKTFAHRVKARDYKKTELLAKNFSHEEIGRIIPEIQQSEFDELNAIVAKLKVESKAILRFLNDGPRFDVALLVDTSLEQIEEA